VAIAHPIVAPAPIITRAMIVLIRPLAVIGRAFCSKISLKMRWVTGTSIGRTIKDRPLYSI
jgi:hypothetical protein